MLKLLPGIGPEAEGPTGVEGQRALLLLRLALRLLRLRLPAWLLLLAWLLQAWLLLLLAHASLRLPQAWLLPRLPQA